MKISIITPTFNSEKTIAATVHSILNQSYKNIEHIIIDNNSKDQTLKIVTDLYKDLSTRLKIICEEDKGISDAFSKGVLNSSGEVIGILNSDDTYFDENVISEVVNCFQNDPSLAFVHGDMIFIDEKFGSNRRKPLLGPVTDGMPYNHPTMFFKKTVYEKYGLFKNEYRYAMDFEFILRFYKSRSVSEVNGHYLATPLVNMYAGGVSDLMELKSIDEVERALKEHKLWDDRAMRKQFMRRFRIKLKGKLSQLGLEKMVVLWRQLKWR